MNASRRMSRWASAGWEALIQRSQMCAQVVEPQWQTYDIIFRRPRFDEQGKVLQAARVTVLHNGALVQDAVARSGPTSHQQRRPHTAHPDALPISLQDHGHPVRFRNIWLRPLEGGQ